MTALEILGLISMSLISTIIIVLLIESIRNKF